MKRKYITYIFIICLSFFCISIITTNNADAKVFKWKDSSGQIHFTDNQGSIPKKYLEHAEKIKIPIAGKSAAKPESLKKPLTEENQKTKKGLEKPSQKKAKEEKSLPPGDPNAISIVEQKEDINDKGDAIFTGVVKNNSDSILTKITITLSVQTKEKPETILSSQISGTKGEGILTPSEKGNFTITSNIAYSSITGYEYKTTWKFIEKSG